MLVVVLVTNEPAPLSSSTRTPPTPSPESYTPLLLASLYTRLPMLQKVGRRPKSIVLSTLLPNGASRAPGSVSAESVIIGE